MDVVGQFTTTVMYNENNSMQPIFIAKNLTTNLLGLLSIQALGVISEIIS